MSCSTLYVRLLIIIVQELHHLGSIESSVFDRPIQSGKYIYSTQVILKRMIVYLTFLVSSSLLNNGFSIVNPVSLDFKSKLSLYGDVELIISDSGTCWLNASLFSNKHLQVLVFCPLLYYPHKFFGSQSVTMNLGLFI